MMVPLTCAACGARMPADDDPARLECSAAQAAGGVCGPSVNPLPRDCKPANFGTSEFVYQGRRDLLRRSASIYRALLGVLRQQQLMRPDRPHPV